MKNRLVEVPEPEREKPLCRETWRRSPDHPSKKGLTRYCYRIIITVMTVMTDLTIVIAHLSDEPIYEQIERQVKQAILTGVLREGDPLPSLRQLAKELRVSVVTTNRAYEDLEKQGFLVTAQGRGAFVAKANVEFLKDKRLKVVEEKLLEAIDMAQLYGIRRSEFSRMVDLLFPRRRHG